MNPRIKKYLNDRGITDQIIESRHLSFNGKIVIPVEDEFGNKIFNIYRKDPDTIDSSPKYTYDKGSKSNIYCKDNLKKSNKIIICEGMTDCLILNALGFYAVTGTGGAGTFLPEWAPLFKDRETYICFDNDDAGRKGCARVAALIPWAKLIPLPFEVKDVTDYFIKLNKTAADFKKQMAAAFVLEIKVDESPRPKHDRRVPDGNDDFSKAKTYPISDFIKVDSRGFASCPFHKEKTASMKVDKNNRFYCFGCSKWGDVIDIVQCIIGVATPKDAVNYILKK